MPRDMIEEQRARELVTYLVAQNSGISVTTWVAVFVACAAALATESGPEATAKLAHAMRGIADELERRERHARSEARRLGTRSDEGDVMILDELDHTVREFIRLNGKPPRALYLSYSKLKAAKEEIARRCGQPHDEGFEGFREFEFEYVPLLSPPAPMWPEVIAAGSDLTLVPGVSDAVPCGS
jgi:hypothetical protein